MSSFITSFWSGLDYILWALGYVAALLVVLLAIYIVLGLGAFVYNKINSRFIVQTAELPKPAPYRNVSIPGADKDDPGFTDGSTN